MMPNRVKQNEQRKESLDQTRSPLIFISHDARDADLAEAFSDLIRSASSNMLKTFQSSSMRVKDGIEFGDIWYERLMEKLNAASVVVCILTKRSRDRPWLLYEAGVAKGKIEPPVFGIALGISLEKVEIGPFSQFENCDDSEKSLIKLVNQLVGKVPYLKPDDNFVKILVKKFRSTINEILIESKPHYKIDPGKIFTYWKLQHPYSVVRFNWKRKYSEVYKIEDLMDEPIVYSANQDYLRLFNLETLPDPESETALTAGRLFERLKVLEVLEPAGLERLSTEQYRLMKDFVLADKFGSPGVNIKFNNKHKYFPNASFLISFIGYTISGDINKAHTMYVLVLFIQLDTEVGTKPISSPGPRIETGENFRFLNLKD